MLLFDFDLEKVVAESIWAIISVDMFAVIIDRNDKTKSQKPKPNPKPSTNCFSFRLLTLVCVCVCVCWIVPFILIGFC